MPQAAFDFSLPYDPAYFTVAPSCFPQAKETSALAAIAIQPVRGKQNVELMHVIRAAGDVGLSDPEIAQRTGFLRATICARRLDCRSQLEPAPTRYEVNGRSYTRWRLKSAYPQVCGTCQGPLTASPEQDCGEATNVDLTCADHGMQFTISTRKDLRPHGAE